MYAVEEPEEIQLSHINQIDGPHFYTEFVQSFDIVYGSLYEMDKYRDITSQVKQCVHLDTRLGSAEPCQRTEFQTEADSATIESINGIV